MCATFQSQNILETLRNHREAQKRHEARIETTDSEWIWLSWRRFAVRMCLQYRRPSVRETRRTWLYSQSRRNRAEPDPMHVKGPISYISCVNWLQLYFWWLCDQNSPNSCLHGKFLIEQAAWSNEPQYVNVWKWPPFLLAAIHWSLKSSWGWNWCGSAH